MICPTCNRDGYEPAVITRQFAIGQKVIYVGMPGRKLQAEILSYSKSGARIVIKYKAPWFDGRMYSAMVTPKMLKPLPAETNE